MAKKNFKEFVKEHEKAIRIGKFGEALKTIESINEHEPIRLMFGTERSYT